MPTHLYKIVLAPEGPAQPPPAPGESAEPGGEPEAEPSDGGVATGITEGVVEEVAGDRFRIRLAPGFPSKYELSEVSDSGALWLEQGTIAPVGLHRAGEDTGVETATGVPIRRVLEALRLQAVTPRAAAEPAPA